MGRNILWKSSLVMTLTLLILSNIIGCSSQEKPVKKERISVEVITVEQTEIVDTVILRGQLKPQEEVMVVPKAPGLKVTDLAVQVGDTVEAGDYLFQLDKTMARKQVEQAKLNYDIAKENYIQQRNLLNNHDNYMEDELLVFQNTSKIPRQYQDMMDQSIEAQQEHQRIEASNRAAAAQLEQARMAYANALDQLSEFEYYSPISGTVSLVNIQKNHMVVNTMPAIIISNVEELKITLAVSAKLLNNLERGTQVKVKQDEMEIVGTIEIINPISDVRNNLHTVEISVDNQDGKLISGGFVLVELNRNTKKDVLVLPKEALLIEGKEAFVFVEKEGKAYKRKLELGIDAGNEVEIVEGLAEGERVIIRGQHFIEDEDPVIVRGGVYE